MMLLNKLLGRSDINIDGDTYMRRWRIIHRRLLKIRVHNIIRSDKDRALHDHPFSFVSLVLWGGYREFSFQKPEGRWYGPGSLIFRPATFSHRIELDKPAWTLVIGGPTKRRWGYWVRGNWVDAEH